MNTPLTEGQRLLSMQGQWLSTDLDNLAHKVNSPQVCIAQIKTYVTAVLEFRDPRWKALIRISIPES